MRSTDDIIDSLDRSSLGRFAVSRSSLLLAYEAMTTSNNAERASIRKALIKSAAAHNESTENAIAEAAFWFNIENRDGSEANGKYINRLRTLSNSPLSYHDYFAANVWDTELIARLIYDKIPPEKAQRVEVTSRAREWVDGLDRSALSTTVVDIELIYLANVCSRWDEKTRTYLKGKDIQSDDVFQEIEVASREAYKEMFAAVERSGFPLEKVWAEMYLWTGEYADVVGYLASGDLDEVNRHLDFMLLLEEAPVSHHPYMVAGIFDHRLIDDAIANDIDPDLITAL